MQNPSQDVGEVFFALCKQVESPYSLGAWLSFKHGSLLALHRPNPRDYCDATTYGKDYLVFSWISKTQVDLGGPDLAVEALKGFIADEEHNAATNRRIREWNLRGSSPRVEALISRVQRKISHILGPFDLRAVLSRCRLGNGATATLPRRRARYDHKMINLPFSVSPGALGFGRALIESDPIWLSAVLRQEVVGPCSLLPQCFEVIDYNVFDTVPKSFKTRRTIAKEPVLNGLLQQGVHVYLRERLKRAGVDLRDQKQNQTWASLASELGLATLDLESASNSVSVELVALLLPDDWLWFLDLLRSRRTRLPDGSIRRNAMFSSMGNAFTFELESLIFYSIAVCTTGPDQIVSVYGDDIVVPQCYAGDVIENLETFGFRINRSKSFTNGRFFESCGVHYYDSFDITPVYQKENPLAGRIERIRAHNRLIRWALRSGMGFTLDSTVKSACSLLIRGHERYAGPIGPEGDSYFQVPAGSYRINFGKAEVNAWVRKPRKGRSKQAGAYAYWHLLSPDAERPSQDGRTLGCSAHKNTFAKAVQALVSAVDDSPNLSECAEDGVYVHGKESIPLERIKVGVDWC